MKEKMKHYLILLLPLFLLVGCARNFHKMETQVVRTTGGLSVLSVVSESDVKGTMSIQTNHSQVTFSYGAGNDVMVDPSRISVQGKLWGEIPEKTTKVLIQFYDNKFTVQLDPEE